MKTKHFLIPLIFIFFFTACEEKVDPDPFHQVLMDYITADTPISPFSVTEFETNSQKEKGFAVQYDGQEIFSGIFDQELARPYDVRLVILKNDEQTGLTIWALYIVSWPLYHSVFFLIREDGKMIQKNIHNLNSAQNAYSMMNLFFDGKNTISLRDFLSEAEQKIKIEF